jgi:hypothetical protein
MSVKVMSAVFDRYPNGGGEMLLALALADHSSDDGSRIYPSIKHLAAKTRQAERSVQYQLRRMEEAGWLTLVNSGNGGRNQHREYQISIEWIKGAEIAPFPKGATDGVKGATDDAKGCNPQQERVQPVAPAYNHQGTIKEPSKKNTRAEALSIPDGVSVQVWEDFLQVRKDKRAKLTATALAGIQSEADKAGFTLEKALSTCCARGWQSFNAEWVAGKPAGMTARNSQAESFAERDARNGRERWEAMTGRTWPADELPGAKPAAPFVIDIEANEPRRLA